MVNGSHAWVLAGPWYRWPVPADPASGRVSRPVFQKFESTNFVTDFLKDPQHSLKFLDPEDFVLQLQPRVPPLPLESGKEASLSKNILVSTGVRKLFLDAHKRFYLVVCELHCDAPGFPDTNRNLACEAGFVVRRRVADVPPAAVKTTTEIVKAMTAASAQIAQIDELPAGQKAGPLALARISAAERFRAATADLHAAAQSLGIRLVVQGWIKSEFDRVGQWREVEETPQTIEEDVLPLYPLVADPRIRDHSGGGRTIYFGVVPTGSADADVSGNARYDDRSLYEIRCFVRRHKPGCPKKRERNDCHGMIVWSQRTESYRLAAQFDLAGTSNRPVTIQLPDIPALEAQAAALPVGQGTPVKMISPPGSPDFSVNTSTMKAKKKAPMAQICSFSLPLITIVATFVFKLFLPILTFVLGLFFLLKLKFCIPPTVTLQADVTAALTASFGGELIGGADGVPGLTATFGATVQTDIAKGLSTDFSSSAPAGVEVSPAPPGAATGELPSITANLAFEPRVEAHVTV
jgi:hypothetical protein